MNTRQYDSTTRKTLKRAQRSKGWALIREQRAATLMALDKATKRVASLLKSNDKLRGERDKAVSAYEELATGPATTEAATTVVE